MSDPPLASLVLLLAATASGQTTHLANIHADLTCAGPPCGGCDGYGGAFEDLVTGFLIEPESWGEGDPGGWLLGPLNNADVGTVFVADADTDPADSVYLDFAATAFQLTDGIAGPLGCGSAIGVYGETDPGSHGYWTHEVFVLGDQDDGWDGLYAELFIPPPNGLDYQGYRIDSLTFTLDHLCIEQDPSNAVWWLAYQSTLGIHGSPGDLDSDGVIGLADLTLLLNLWGPCADPCIADFDGDGMIGVIDLLLVLANWG